MEKDNPKAGTAEAPHLTPSIVIDLGRRSKKAIKRLKRGEGRLVHEVNQAVDQVRATLPETDKNKQIIPVVIVYRKKGKRKGTGFPLNPLSPLNFLRC